MRRSLFLYLALACFAGLLAIFVVDGYIGIYETLYITAGEREEKIEPDFWLREGRIWSVGANREETVFFRYTVANRRFSSHESDIEVSVWHSQEKVRELMSQPISIAAFDTEELEWIIDTAEFLPDEDEAEQVYEYTVIIRQGEIERKIILFLNSRTHVRKVVPAPPR